MNPEQYDELAPIATQVGDEVRRVDELNKSFAAAEEGISFTGLKTVTESNIAARQLAAWNTMRYLAASLPYDEMGRDSLTLEAEVARLHEKLSSNSGMSEEANAKLTQELKLAKTLTSEECHGALDMAAEQVMARAASASREDLEAQLQSQRKELAVIDKLMELAGDSWPVPQAFDYRAVLRAEQPGIIDELPVDVEQKVNPNDSPERKYRIDNNHTSQDLLEYFLDERNGCKVVTVDELIEYVYSDEVIAGVDGYYMRSRITGRLGLVHGAPIREALSNEGLVLQYGMRYRATLDKHGNAKKVGEGKRVYRAVPRERLDEFGGESWIVTIDGTFVAIDSWSNVPDADAKSEDFIKDSSDQTEAQTNTSNTANDVIARLISGTSGPGNRAGRRFLRRQNRMRGDCNRPDAKSRKHPK